MSKARDEAGSQLLYTRGKYRLEWDRRRDGTLRSPNLQITWYDEAAGRNRSRTCGTSDITEAEEALDRLYLQRERGQAICTACGQPMRSAGRHLLTTAIADYLVAREARTSIGSIRPRLAHVTAYLGATDQTAIGCEEVDADWIDDFREWAIDVPVVLPNKSTRARAPGTVEASVRQLAAVINFAHGRKDTIYPASFTAKSPRDVDRTPTYRSDVKELAAMFRYALKPGKDGKPMRARQPLLRFLQISVATWARPDAAHDVSTSKDRQQWRSAVRVLDLNYRGRVQTRKRRPTIPVGERMAALLDARDGFYVGVESVKHSFASMLDELALPRDGETGMKLIRRSMATIGRKRLGEANWYQGQIMLGHLKHSTSDLYALFDPAVLGLALGVTNDVIDEIEALAPGAFHREGTGMRVIEGGLKSGKNG